MFGNKKPDKIEYSDLPEHPRQMLEILAKLDEIDRKLGAWADNVKRFDQKLATVIEHRNQSVKATTMGLQWARDVERKLDTLIEQRNQPMQPVEEPVVEEPTAKKKDRRGYRAKIFYVTDPLGFVERKIDLATRTSKCVYLAALLVAVNDGAKGNRETITAAKLSELLLELVRQDRITPITSKGTGDIGVRLTSDKPLQPTMSLLSIVDFKIGVNLFSRWSNNG